VSAASLTRETTAIVRTVSHVSALFCLIMAAAMLLPALVDLAQDNEDWRVFMLSAFLIAAVGALVGAASRGEPMRFNARLGFLLVTSVWVVATLAGALPLYFASAGLSFAGAVFESMSGLTTTGATVISGLDNLPPGLLLWRSLLHWIGGIGIVVMAILILPQLRIGGLALFQMESSDKSDKVLPRVNQLAAGLAAAYVALTLACAVAYAGLGMSVFEAVNHAMSTISTGGFSTHDASLGFFRDNRILVVATLFMLLGSLPFVIYVRAFLPRRFQRRRDPQIAVFLVICLVLSLSLAVSRRLIEGTPFGEALISASFNLVSLISTTGFVSEDYTLWSDAAVGIFFIALFLGGCAGSTAGGIKANRLVVLYKLVDASFRRLVRPHAVIRLRYGETEILSQTVQAVTIFFFLYFGVLLVGTVLLGMLGLDLLTAFSGTLTCLSNVGPGFGPIIGPAGNFSSLTDAQLWVLTAVMLLGRLEIVTVVILFLPSIWMR
jgi:trk system potassium uptake protein